MHRFFTATATATTYLCTHAGSTTLQPEIWVQELQCWSWKEKLLPWKWAPLEPQTGQKYFISSCLRWWCRGAKPGGAKALEGEKLPDSPPTNYRIHSKLKSMQIIMGNNRILLTEPSSMRKGRADQKRNSRYKTKCRLSL